MTMMWTQGRLGWLVGAALLMVAAPGCVLPVAWANPPIQASVSGGGQLRGVDGGAQPLLEVEATARPTKAWRASADFPVSPGVGGLLQSDELRRLELVCPYGDVEVTVLEWGRNEFWRSGRLQLVAGALMSDTDLRSPEFKPVGTVRVSTGRKRFAASETGGDCASGTRSFFCGGGVFHGQFRADLFAEASALGVDDRFVLWQVSFGISVNVPSSAGAGVFLLIPGS
ncbi:MAG: hypothetical protein CMH57_00510 [Myxococcales bacterium]|nr:hypothetical protein [Myxococcales bacterium]